MPSGGAVKKSSMVGAMGVIARNGKIIFHETWGKADRENDVAMAKDTIFRIYSMSKPITSVALMTLYEEGKFELDDPIGKYIPRIPGTVYPTLESVIHEIGKLIFWY